MKEEKETKKISPKKNSSKSTSNNKKQTGVKNSSDKKVAPKKNTAKISKTTSTKVAPKSSTKKISNKTASKSASKKNSPSQINKTKASKSKNTLSESDITKSKSIILQAQAEKTPEVATNSSVKEEIQISKNNEVEEIKIIEMKKNKIKGYELFIIAGSLALLIALVLMVNKNNLDAHCKKAICNESGTICYNYELDKDGNTKKTWKGSCANK